MRSNSLDLRQEFNLFSAPKSALGFTRLIDQPNRPKTIDEIKSYLLERTIAHRNPMDGSREADVRRVLSKLDSMDPDLWAELWSAEARPHEQIARDAEQHGDAELAHESFMLAYQYYRLARFPCPNTEAKGLAAHLSRANYISASRYFDPPLEVIDIPFEGLSGEGSSIRVYLRRPDGVAQPPVAIQHGGIDGYKEERHRYAEPLLRRGIASLAIDMPGTGESPVKGGLHGERIYATVLDYLDRRTDLDGSRVGLIGGSFGGYWAAKAAHVFPERFAGVVDWGGGTHYGFQPNWIESSRFAGSYLTDLIETRAHAFGLTSYEEWLQFAPSLSLLDQGLLDGEHAPMLLINGRDDAQTPIEDLYILLAHGSYKSARVFPGGHMGQTPETYPTIVGWIAGQLLS